MQSKTSKTKQKPNATPVVLREWSFDAIGTRWWIGVYQALSDNAFEALQTAVADRIEAFDMVYSRFRDDSLVGKVARTAGTYPFPPDSHELFATYQELYEVTDGAVTPLIGQTLSDAGYDASYSLEPGKVMPPPKWDDVMTYNNGTLTTSEPVLLDFGAAGKGYLVDIVAALLRKHGMEQYCVDAGGDMVCHGLVAPLRVGLENPVNAAEAVGVVELQNTALCGSAGNRRAWGAYHHILDPVSLRSPQHISALWVAAENACTADGVATALFFVEPGALQKAFTFEYLVLYADNKVARSAAFPGDIFSE